MEPRTEERAAPRGAATLERDAARVLAQVGDAPARARRGGERIAREARAHGDRAAESVALRAVGLAAVDQRAVADGLRHLRAAVRVAERGGHRRHAGEARLSLALGLLYAGRTADALRTIDVAAHDLEGALRGHAAMQRGYALLRAGRLVEAERDLATAIRVALRHDDALGEARARNNLGLVRAYRGELADAARELERAAMLFDGLGQRTHAGEARNNLGWAQGRLGELPSALEVLDRVQAERLADGLPCSITYLDRCELLLAAGLPEEALAAARDAVEELARGHAHADLAEARLAAAQAALACGDAPAARADAASAARAFARQQRSTWHALARYVALRAERAAAPPAASLPARARAVASALRAGGFVSAAADAELVAAEAALALGRPRAAARALDAVRAGAPQRRRRDGGGLALAVRARRAEALAHAAAGDRRAARAALAAGLALVEEQRALLGASELRVRVSSHGEELAALGARLALEDGDAAAVLHVLDRARAAALRYPPARPPADGELAADLAALRAATGELEAAALDGAPLRALHERVTALEGAVRRRVRHARGTHAPLAPVGRRELAAALAERALVVYGIVDGALHAATLHGGRHAVHALGAADALAAEVESAASLLRRAAAPARSAALDAARRQGLDAAAAALDAALVAPLGLPADAPLVVVPTGGLHGVPWAALPGLATRAFTVAPSATSWARAHAHRAAPGTAVFAAGPDLPAARGEALALAGAAGAPALVDGDATVARVLAALEGAGVAHIAAHGALRAGNPLFSGLRLADGVLTVYELERLARPPALVVLAACESAASVVHAGDELMGMAAALLQVGVRSLIASPVHVSDAGTRAVVEALHAQLARGSAPARALADVRAALAGGADPLVASAARAFTCLGAGT